jgi:succinate dehydrogenase / fumarate reductase cytochrome b subunit
MLRSHRIKSLYQTGAWAWWGHRLTGLVILAYLYFHLIALSSVIWPHGATAFNRVVKDLTQPPFILADLALFAVILYHAANGIRVLLIDLGIAVAWQKTLFAVAMALAAAVFVASAWLLLPLAQLP